MKQLVPTLSLSSASSRSFRSMFCTGEALQPDGSGNSAFSASPDPTVPNSRLSSSSKGSPAR